MSCPSYISNETAAQCIGNLRIDSPEFAFMMLMALPFIVFGAVLILNELDTKRRIPSEVSNDDR